MWNDIEILVNDDTRSEQLSVCLGRECGSALYQVDSLLQITSSEKVSVNPQLYACSSRDGSIIVVDKSVILLDSMGQAVLLHIQFDTDVDVVGMCQEKQFLVVGERSGNIHLIHIPSKQTLLTKILAETSSSEKTYLNLCIEKDKVVAGVYHMFILTSKGFFCIMNLPLAKTQEAIDKMDMTAATMLQGQIKTAFIATEEYHSLGCQNFVMSNLVNKIHMIIGGKGDYVLSKWEVDTTNNLVSVRSFADSSLIKDAVKLQVLDNLLFVLDTENILSIWDVYSLTLIWDLPLIHIEEFLLTTESDSSSVMQLNRLLHKHKFTEAENFAIQFGLDVELVYKVKANTILEKLASASIGSYGQEVLLDYVNEAKENLHKIQDSQFVVDYCINAPWPLYETAQEMLNYAKVRILKKDDRTIVSPSDGALVSLTEADFENSFDEKMLESLLNAIHITVPLRELCLWLKNVVIPFLRRVVPMGQKILAKWLEQGARNLELTDKANWPENGLQMAEIFFTSKNQDETHLTSFGQWTPLENTTTIVFRMFDKILAPELVPSILDKFIKPYLCEHNLQKDELLLQYIKDLLERCRTRSASVFETAWEAKAIAVIGCISDTDLKFDAVLQIMHGAVVPWSGAVEQLVKQHLEMNHSKVKLLQESYRLMEMKKLLRAYGIRDTNLLKDKQMIMRLVKYILKQDTATSLEDALKMVEAYMLPTMEVYILRMIDLIDKERGEESLTLLKSLTIAEAEKVAERLTVWGTLVLQRKADNSEEQKTQMFMTKTLVEVLKFLYSIQRDNPLKKDECEANLKTFETLATLQEDFDIFLSVEDFGNPMLMSTLLEKHINAYEMDRYPSKSGKEQAMTCKTKDGKLKSCSTESRLYRIALLLQRSEQEMGEKLALRALDAGRIEDAVKICRNFYKNHCNKETGKLLFSACQRLCHMLGADVPMITPEDMNLPAVIYEMACQAATVCSPDLLLDSLELCKYTLAAKEIYRQCQIENYGFTAKTTCFGGDKDPYEEWTYNDFFNEDGIVLDPQIVLPVIYETISSLLPISGKLTFLNIESVHHQYFTLISSSQTPVYKENKLYPLDSTSLANCAFIKGQNLLLPARTPICAVLQNLMECSQCELALRLIVCSFGSCLQHGISNYMDLSLSEKLHDGNTLAETKSFLIAMKQKSASAIMTTIMTLLHKVFNCRLIDQDLALGYCTILPREDMFNKLWDVINNTWQNYRKVLAVALVGAQLATQYGEAAEEKKFRELITDAEWGIQLGKFGISFETVFRQAPIRKKELIRTLVQNPEVGTDLILNYCRTFMLDSDAALQLCIETLLLKNANRNHTEDDSAEYSEKQSHYTLLARVLEIIPLLKSTNDLVTSLSGILYKLDPYDYETIEIVLKVIQNADERNTSIQLNQVSLDTLHMSAAQHVFKKKLKPKIFEMRNTGYTSVVNKETTKTVQTIQSYLLSIVNPEWAVAMAHKIAQEFPTGPDQIQALKFCLYLAEKWLKNATTKDESHEKAEVLQKKLYMQYKRSATENVLITYKLNTAEHLKSIAKPANLIVLLYEHHSIDQRIQNPTGRDYPDIHAAAKEIAEINNLDMNKILDKLLNKWLCPNTLPSEKTQEVFEDVQEDEELRRYFLKCCIYLAEFEVLNIPYTYESFHKSPKEGMIKGLWKNHSHEPTAVRLVTELSLEYKVYDIQLWNGLLQKLLGFNMIQYLRKVLIAITGIHLLWQIPNFSRAWRSVVLSPFLTASCPPSPKQIEECSECFVMLLKCPVLADLDVIGIAKQYAQLDLPAFALGCLMLIPQSEKREQQIQAFLSTCNTETVLQQIDEHMNTGEVVAFASQIRSLILDSIINEKLYEKFLKTKYFPLVKQQLMNTHRMKELVDYLASKNCTEDAAALIREYQEKYGNPTLLDKSSSDVLKMYLNGPQETCVLDLSSLTS
ncbi:hypothetical protein ASZ78_002075 [Callipepla squamata]|uniref:RZZ complex subunit KNTC1/ROD C-terminal domain-containing protein n=1 Tax=Callipepla squamata TaxID=9009 RepID=A0A226N978_CALSU|nr:hypothetical protein ASZ78_002075 [Callipepla squamata]